MFAEHQPTRAESHETETQKLRLLKRPGPFVLVTRAAKGSTSICTGVKGQNQSDGSGVRRSHAKERAESGDNRDDSAEVGCVITLVSGAGFSCSQRTHVHMFGKGKENAVRCSSETSLNRFGWYLAATAGLK